LGVVIALVFAAAAAPSFVVTAAVSRLGAS
jgi:hypothetical protein